MRAQRCRSYEIPLSSVGMSKEFKESDTDGRPQQKAIAKVVHAQRVINLQSLRLLTNPSSFQSTQTSLFESFE